MNEKLLDVVIGALEDQKAVNITPLPVQEFTCLTDYMVVASGTSSRHVSAIAENLVQTLKSKGFKPVRYEDDPNGEWMLVDVGDVVIHVMHPRTRAFYNLEKLWGKPDALPDVNASMAPCSVTL